MKNLGELLVCQHTICLLIGLIALQGWGCSSQASVGKDEPLPRDSNSKGFAIVVVEKPPNASTLTAPAGVKEMVIADGYKFVSIGSSKEWRVIKPSQENEGADSERLPKTDLSAGAILFELPIFLEAAGDQQVFARLEKGEVFPVTVWLDGNPVYFEMRSRK